MSSITVTELHSLLQQQPVQNVIDVRTPVEFAEVHVEAAINVPLNELSPDDIHERHRLSLERPIYIFCRAGQRAARAAEWLTRDGFPNAVVVEGGTLAWLEAELPVIRGHSTQISLERQVRIGAGFLVLAGLALGFLVHPAYFGLSAFVGTGLVFAGVTDWCGLGLLLARAPWNQKKV